MKTFLEFVGRVLVSEMLLLRAFPLGKLFWTLGGGSLWTKTQEKKILILH